MGLLFPAFPAGQVSTELVISEETPLGSLRLLSGWSQWSEQTSCCYLAVLLTPEQTHSGTERHPSTGSPGTCHLVTSAPAAKSKPRNCAATSALSFPQLSQAMRAGTGSKVTQRQPGMSFSCCPAKEKTKKSVMAASLFNKTKIYIHAKMLDVAFRIKEIC